MNDRFDNLRPYLLQHLLARGINPRKRFRCLNPDHPDRDPSMSYDPKRHKVHCFACGATYDLFDLLTIEDSLSSPGEALRRAEELYGQGLSPASPAKRAAKPAESATAPPLRSGSDPAATSSGGPVPEEATAYFASRGLSSRTVARFGLGYEPDRRCVCLPCDGGAVVRRRIDEKRYLNEKGQPSPLFHVKLFWGETPVFLTEGVFDALSAEEMGFAAAAMNGSGNREKIAALLRESPPACPILLAPDNDQAGEEWAEALVKEFPQLYRCPPIPNGKDLNESLVADWEGLYTYLSEAVEAGSAHFAAHQPPAYETLSAAGQLEAFHAYIAHQADRPPLETGFKKLDEALDGGLYDGLYVIGAVSSLGKTAFCMQMADQLAQQGRDVLIFSLEMTAFELMARSISRESFRMDCSAHRQQAKTVRGILDGRRYARYSVQEKALLETAERRYAQYAGHLYFREGDHETGLDYIESELRRHIEETGVVPVVLIDYLQIIAPVDVHFTDKQNLDRIVCALKKLSRSTESTIFAISSFNRENYNLEVSMNAFKESGGIDYSADVLMGLQARGAGRPGFNMDQEKRRNPRELELKILKNRSAAVPDPLPLRYYPAFSCFEETK